MCGSYLCVSDKTLQSQGFEEIALVRLDFVIRYFCSPWRWKYPEMATSSTIQVNIGLHMFLAQFLVEKKFFHERLGFNFFSPRNADKERDI